MKHILVYSDSLSWGIIPATRMRLPFEMRWPGVMEMALVARGYNIRVIEDCLNGRRTVWDDPFKPGRNGLIGLAQRIEVNSPLELVIIMLGTNDFQSTHENNAWHSSQGIRMLVSAVRNAPIEPEMPVPAVLVVSPPAIRTPEGIISPKFAGGEKRCIGLAEEFKQVCMEMNCGFFDSGKIISTSKIDGVHLDADQHSILGNALTEVVPAILDAGHRNAT